MKEKTAIYIYIKFNDFKERVVIVNYLVYETHANELCCRFHYDQSTV